MPQFASYVYPLSDWLILHPYWALFITFLISFSESLVVIGGIIPGSITMTAIGILAGAGFMRIDLTIACAILGAIAGDAISYLIGYKYSDKIPHLWPFKKNPGWLLYGKQYFEQHGGKSVFIGRFIGPLRAIIPLIAGIMRMNHLQFLLANVISAILWSILYVVPGILIGTASTELSSEAARNLFIIIFAALFAGWLLVIISRWCFNKVHNYLAPYLQSSWRYLLLIFIFTAGINIFTTFFNPINAMTYLFWQSLHMPVLNTIFTTFNQMLTITYVAIIILGISIVLVFIAIDKKMALIFIRMNLIICLSVGSISTLTYFSSNILSLITTLHPDFPPLALTLYIGIIAFFYCYTHRQYSFIIKTTRIVLGTFLSMLIASVLYFGTYWLSEIIAAITLGLSIALANWVSYKKVSTPTKRKKQTLVLSLTIILAMWFTNLFLNKPTIFLQNKTAPIGQYSITNTAWWEQDSAILPLYRMNRFGKPAAVLNLQYKGALTTLKKELLQNGWKIYPNSTTNHFMQKILNFRGQKHITLFPKLYKGETPAFTADVELSDNSGYLLLMLWDSHTYTQPDNQPIWIGSITARYKDKSKPHEFEQIISNQNKALKQFKAFETGFKYREVNNDSTAISINILLLQ